MLFNHVYYMQHLIYIVDKLHVAKTKHPIVTKIHLNNKYFSLYKIIIHTINKFFTNDI